MAVKWVVGGWYIWFVTRKLVGAWNESFCLSDSLSSPPYITSAGDATCLNHWSWHRTGLSGKICGQVVWPTATRLDMIWCISWSVSVGEGMLVFVISCTRLAECFCIVVPLQGTLPGTVLMYFWCCKVFDMCLQCFDAVGWAAGRASSL